MNGSLLMFCQYCNQNTETRYSLARPSCIYNTLPLYNSLDKQLYIYLNHRTTVKSLSPFQRLKKTLWTHRRKKKCYPSSKAKVCWNSLYSSELTTGACIATEPGCDRSIHFHMREKAATALRSPATWSPIESQVTHPIYCLENTSKHHSYHLAPLIKVQLTASRLTGLDWTSFAGQKCQI